MKVHNSYKYGIVSLVVAIFFFTGCTYVLKTSEIPTLQTGSPLRGVAPKTFAFKEFKDVRNVTDPLLIRDAGLIPGTHTYILEQPPAVLVAMWMKKELERNGHKCVTFSSDVKADFIVDGSIYKYEFILISGITGTHAANTAVKIMISRVPTATGVFIKNYNGSFNGSPNSLGWLDVFKDAFDRANLSMIKEISTDTELIEFIKK